MSGDIITIELIKSEALALLRPTEKARLHPATRLTLASILLADDEGVAVLKPKQAQRWCSSTPGGMAGLTFVRGQIDELIERGVLAPGSTELELRSMIGRRAEVEDSEQDDTKAAA
ncbi:hypothetical protein [Brachybacterium tyrofermentans]|uniref:hypothetical protein n=1 Tax=Brachybacterium tyrofermentans TaxID=47848 RepID=UPI0018671241|nr:hypothetical protein [Brachybacterium tyrofermentans]